MRRHGMIVVLTRSIHMKSASDFTNNFYIYGIIFIFHILLLSFVFLEDKPFIGSVSYSHIAENWLEKGMYSLDRVNYTFYRPPLYPLMLTVAKVINHSQWEVVARLLQCLLSIGCSLLIFKITLKVSSTVWAAFLALSLYLLSFLLQSEHLMQRETVLFEFLGLCYCYIFIQEKFWDWKKIIFLALITAGLYLTRPTGVLFFLTGLMLIIWYERKIRKQIKMVLVFVVFFTVFISPWQLYQYLTFSKISISSSNTSGLNLYKGTSPAIQSIYPQIDVDHAKEFILMDLQQHGIDPKDEYLVNSYLSKKAVHFVKTDPQLFVRNMVVKFLAFYSPAVLPLGKGDLEFYEEKILVKNYSISIDLLRINYFIICIIIIPLGIIEVLNWKNNNDIEGRFKLFLLIIFFLFTCVHMLTFAETRFRLPLDGFLCILAGIFLYKKKELFFNKFKKREYDFKK